MLPNDQPHPAEWTFVELKRNVKYGYRPDTTTHGAWSSKMASRWVLSSTDHRSGEQDLLQVIFIHQEDSARISRRVTKTLEQIRPFVDRVHEQFRKVGKGVSLVEALLKACDVDEITETLD